MGCFLIAYADFRGLRSAARSAGDIPRSAAGDAVVPRDGAGCAPAQESRASKAKSDEPLLVEEQPQIERAERLVRTAVATMATVEPFGWMVAQEAKARVASTRQGVKAVVGDGGNWIGPAELHFPGFVQVLDFLHFDGVLYVAATAAYRGKAKAAWGLYEQWIRQAWSGQAQVGDRRSSEAACEQGPPPPQARTTIRRIASLALEYVRSNAQVDELRELSSSGLAHHQYRGRVADQAVQQTGQGNRAVLARRGAEAILQVRAAYLSEDNRVASFTSTARPAGPPAETASGGLHKRPCTLSPSQARPPPTCVRPQMDGNRSVDTVPTASRIAGLRGTLTIRPCGASSGRGCGRPSRHGTK